MNSSNETLALSDPALRRRKPRLFIASSSEGLAYAKALKKLLKPGFDCDTWNEGAFRPGEYTLESLIERSANYDGAVVVATADDRVWSRAREAAAPRDNLILEYGLFVATFGRRRALLVVEGGRDMKLPTDVAGLTYLPFRRTRKPAKGLRDAAVAMNVLAQSWAGEPVLDDMQHQRIDSLLELLISEFRNRSNIEADFGLHVFLIDRRYKKPRMVRVARKRITPKAPQPRSFAIGEGITGTCWEREDEVLVDFESEPYASATAEEWETLSDDVRVGMNWAQFDQSRKRFKAVGAVPITGYRAGTGFAGCLSYNLGHDSKATAEDLREPEVKGLLGLCAEGMAAVLGHY